MAEVEHLEALPTSELSILFQELRTSDASGSLTVLQLIADRAQEDKDFESMLKWYEEIIHIAIELDDLEIQAKALHKTGYALFILDREEDAIEKYREAGNIRTSLGDDREYLNCLTGIVDCHIFLDQHSKVIEVAENALTISRILEEHSISGEMALDLADAYYQLESGNNLDVLNENHLIGLEYAEEALTYFQNTGDLHDITRAIIEVCQSLNYLERYDEATARLSEAIAVLQDSDVNSESETTKKLIAKCFRIKGQVLGNQEKYNEALEALTTAHETLDNEISDNESRAIIHWAKSDSYKSLREPTLAIEEIQIAMKAAEKLHTKELYYKCMDDLVRLMYANDREIEALFMSRGAMAEYESNLKSEMTPDLYLGFIIHAALCLHLKDRWEELLVNLDKVQNLRDYIIPVGRAVRVDALRAEALFKIGQSAESLEVLDALLNYGEIDDSDEDFGDSLLIRALIKHRNDPESAKEDFRRGKAILDGLDRPKKVTTFLKSNPELQYLVDIEP